MRKLIQLGLLLSLLVAPVASQAAFHLMSIREVYAGSLANPQSQYVVLQMRNANQNQLSGHSITVYNAAGAALGTYTFTSAVANGANQSFVLIATPAAVSEFGIAADLSMNADLLRAGGRVCFDNIDCFAWGNYSASPILPCSSTGTACQTGTPFRASEGLAPGRAARRDISANNPALLEAADDTGSSTNDFDYAPDPRPVNNAGQAAAAPVTGTGVALQDFSSINDLRASAGVVSQSGVLRLTPVESAPAAASVWHRQRQRVIDGFQTRFRFRLTPNGGSGAEGFAFVIQNESSSSLGAGAQRLGYEGITNGVAIEFDTRFSSAAEIGGEDPDPSTSPNHVSIHSAGTGPLSASETGALAVAGPLPQLDDGGVHTALVTYIPGSPGTLRVFVDDLVTPVAQAAVDLPALLDLTDGAAFVGFTAGSGTVLGEQDLLRWEFAQTLPADCQEGQLQFRIVQAAITEGAARTVAVDRVGGTCGAVSVSYSASGTAAAGTDYTAVGGTLSWPAGNANPRSIILSSLGDEIDEARESVILTLANPSGGAVLGEATVFTLLINDDDPTPVLTITAPPTTTEGTVDANFTVSLDRPSDRRVAVRLLTSGTATRRQDYSLATPLIEFAPGVTAVTRALDPTRRDIVPDGLTEPDETIVLTLDRPGAAVLGSPSSATITILANER